ncbi:NF-kappa-B inhibitor alpha-like [Dreissena polymorpha]|uniref:Uncharacterized protein n=1 Tax=Dreissena polymorpha TaxID=45954 RepID=A0A9D4EJ90_DREPO|nr:NF-kappa-B inhibitor alpha-like [Dreissena polymorpha]KAH3780269.1 hypothetical protein DPMN_158081 [Dreissena polymorpha]
MDKKHSDLDSLVETDECPTHRQVSGSILTPHHYSKVSDETRDESKSHFKEHLSAEIDRSKEKEPQQQKDNFQEIEDVTQRFSDFGLNDRLIEHKTEELCNVHNDELDKYHIKVFTNDCKDSLAVTEECLAHENVSSSILGAHHLSKASVSTKGESEEHFKEDLSDGIELGNVKEEQEQHVFTNTCLDADGDSPLHLAIICTYSIEQISVIIHTVLNRFPDHDVLNHQNYQHRQTPLHLAVLTGRTDIVRFLLRLGARTTLQDNQLRTPLHIACGNGDVEILKALLETKDDEITRSVSLYDNQGQTCLHTAVLNGNIELVKVLLENGTNINAHDRKSGRTALHFAVETGDKSMITCLIKYCGLKVDSRTFTRKTPAQLAYGSRATRADVVDHLRRCPMFKVSVVPSDYNDDSEDGDNDDFYNDNTDSE